MPCFKCTNGKYKFGRSGACKHSSKGACDRANRKTPKRKVYGKANMERAVTERLRKEYDS